MIIPLKHIFHVFAKQNVSRNYSSDKNCIIIFDELMNILVLMEIKENSFMNLLQKIK